MGNACSAPPASGSVEIFGMAVSANAMGPVLLATHLGAGGLTVCNLMAGEHKKPEFTAMNPFQQIPTMRDSDGFCLSESNAILRYIATKYGPAFYPDDPKKRGTVDWALDNFVNQCYTAAVLPVVYTLMGFGAAPADQAAANAKAVDSLNAFCAFFLKGTFVGGEALTIADFKIAPFFFALAQPALQTKLHFKCPARVVKFNQDFAGKVDVTALKSAGGYSIAEFMASKA